MRTTPSPCDDVWPTRRSPGSLTKSVHACQVLRPRRVARALAIAHSNVLPDLPHWVALDASGNVYVADRENQRIQVFDSAGHFISQWAGKQLGRPYAIAIDKHWTAYIADGGDQPDIPPDRSAWVLVRADGVPLVRVGRFGNYDGQFEMAHSIAVDGKGAVYVGDITGARVQKFVRSGAPAGRVEPAP
jgi:DNA-binding beta-propeller fold protein YncE